MTMKNRNTNTYGLKNNQELKFEKLCHTSLIHQFAVNLIFEKWCSHICTVFQILGTPSLGTYVKHEKM